MKILQWLTKNLGWRILSLLLAIFIWMQVATEPEMDTVVSVPVQYTDAGNNLEISSRLTERIEIETRGPSGRLRDLSNSRIAVILDFTGVREPGERTFTITRDTTNLPRGVELLRATPAQIRLVFERRLTRTVPVRVRFTGTPPQGLSVTGYQAVPSMASIMGPESKVSLVEAVETDVIDLAAIDPRKPSVRRAAYVAEPNVRFAGSPEVTVRIELQ